MGASAIGISLIYPLRKSERPRGLPDFPSRGCRAPKIGAPCLGPRLPPLEELGEELLPNSWPDRLRFSDSLTGALPNICPELLPLGESDLDGLAACCSERRLLDELPNEPPDDERLFWPFVARARRPAPTNSSERLPSVSYTHLTLPTKA